MRKAFDTISQNALYDILSYYGIKTNFFKSYLTNRLQYVQIHGVKSQKTRINYGVPQGSILGPLLFTIYINLLPTVTSMHTNLYADDTVFVVNAKDPNTLQERANEQLKLASDWFNNNSLTLAPEKTVYLLHNAKKSQTINIEMNGCTLTRVTETKYVGVIIDEKLSWKPHIDYIARKTRQNNFLLNKVKHIFPAKLKLWLYNALIKPYLEYCCAIWGHQNTQKLKIIQKRSIRCINGSKNMRCHTNDIFRKFNVLKMEDLVRYCCATFVHKIRYNRGPLNICLMFEEEDPLYSTRSASKEFLTLPNWKQDWMRKNIQFQGAKIWNDIPQTIRRIVIPEEFKVLLKQHYLNEYKKYKKCDKILCISCKK